MTAEGHKYRKSLSKKEAKIKAASFCAYQERTQQEVREKLFDLHVTLDEAEEIISELIQENFINEERFAKAYAGGKFRIKKWGRVKIIQGLKQKGISEYCIKKGLAEIDEEEYLETLKEQLQKKSKGYKGPTALQKKKLSQYLIGKGYEADMVWEQVNTWIK